MGAYDEDKNLDRGLQGSTMEIEGDISKMDEECQRRRKL